MKPTVEETSSATRCVSLQRNEAAMHLQGRWPRYLAYSLAPMGTISRVKRARAVALWDSAAAPYAFLASAALIYDGIMVPRYVGHLFLQLGKIQVSEHM